MAAVAIGSDTGGSCRIPAALCGIAGFKPTASRISLEGAIPLSSSYDSVGSLAPSVACCALIDAVMAGQPDNPLTPLAVRGLRLAVASNIVLLDMDAQVAVAYERALAKLAAAGAVLQQVEFASWNQLADLGQHGGLVAAESWAWHAKLIGSHAGQYDPRVLSRIRRGSEQGVAEYLCKIACRESLCRQAEEELRPFDAVVMPTVPIIAPRIAELSDDDTFASTNLLLLRNPAIANMLDLCAVSIPCHEEGSAPVGLMMMGRHMSDRHLLAAAMGIEGLFRTNT